MKFFLHSCLLMISHIGIAQSSPDLFGEYNASRQELATAFLLKPDSTFEFYFSYGALDRFGQGTFHVTPEQIIFTSDNQAKPDFSLVKESASGNAFTVQLQGTGDMTEFFSVTAFHDGKAAEAPVEADGFARFPEAKYDSLNIAFQFAGEKHFSFYPKPGTHQLLFDVEPSILNVSFATWSMKRLPGAFEGRLPFTDLTPFTFRKGP